MAVRKITIRRGTASSWTSANPTLSSGELGYESDTGKLKIGTGSTAWNSLAYFGAGTLDELSDVTITSASNGDFLRWNGSAWINDAVNLSTDTIGDYVQALVAGTGISLANNSGEASTPTVSLNATLDNLSDVTITSVSNGQVLKWNGSAWVNASDSTGTTINSLDDIGDVVITSVSSGQVLKWNGSAWANASESGGSATNLDGLTDVAINNPSNNQFLVYYDGQWFNATRNIPQYINDLTDVYLDNTPPQVGDVLTYTQFGWQSAAPTGGVATSSTPHPFALMV